MESTTSKKVPAAVALGALGVVFGDIGTSPLYAFRECFGKPDHGTPQISPENLLGAASLIFWALVFIVSFKYVQLVLKLDNRGEGGVLSLAALLRHAVENEKKQKRFFALGLLGAALIYADGMLTPSISVLSAVEGFKLVMPHIPEWEIAIISCVILIGLFSIQRFGTSKVGVFFGPIVLLWFVVMGAIGFASIIKTPDVLWALSPHAALMFMIHEWYHGLPLLAAVFLAVTGGEALYADLGHFGRRPIRLAWFAVAFPGLVLNYLGQAALLQRDPSAIENPFFRLVPNSMVLPLTIMATMAAIIASQALITGAFSLTAQAIQLSCLPRLRMLHTSLTEKGHIYLPMVNWLLALACVILVATFKSSAALAAAYGIAISLTMTLTTILFWFSTKYIWGWSPKKAAALGIVFLIVDAAFLFSNSLKIIHGGWLPLVVAAVVVFLITTWMWGRMRAGKQLEKQKIPLEDLLSQVERGTIPRVRGTAIFMTGREDSVPVPLLHNLKHNGVLHERLMLMHVVTLDVPTARADERFSIRELGHGFYFVKLQYGFSEEPDVPAALKANMPPEIGYHPGKISFFLGRETIVVSRACNAWNRLRLAIFASMLRNATPASAYFKLPPNRVVELGAQVTL